MAKAPAFMLVLCVGVVFSQTHTNDHQKLSDLQTEFDRMKTNFEDFKNRTSNEIQQLRERNSFLASVQSTNVQTLNTLMTDVFKVRAKLGFITMDSVQQNSSLDIVLDTIQRLDKLNSTVREVANAIRSRNKCQRGNQYIRECHNPNWEFARCGNITVHVNFAPAFDEVPYVMLGVSKVDAGSGHNTRFQAFTSAITEKGFDYTIGTWGDSELWGSTFEWLACPY